jgi:hypothetical protein
MAPQDSQWHLDPVGQELASRYFTVGEQSVPTNPKNYLSYIEKPGAGFSSNNITRVNPYGDAVEQAMLSVPALVQPVPAASRIMAPAPAPGAEQQVNTPGYGVDPRRSQLSRIDTASYQNVPPPLGEPVAPAAPLGMSTGVRPVGTGPQRNVRRPG